jgi:hypothetical protein
MQALRHTIQVRSRQYTSSLLPVAVKWLIRSSCRATKSMSNPVEDPLGCFAEKGRYSTRAQLKDLTFLQRLHIRVHVKPNSPARYFTYSQLCRPIITLEMSHECGTALRRIVLRPRRTPSIPTSHWFDMFSSRRYFVTILPRGPAGCSLMPDYGK